MTMEALGIATNILAIIELSAKVASVCLQYSKGVKNARADIDRLFTEVNNLENVAKSFHELLESSHADKLKISQQLFVTIENSRSHLQELEQKLHSKTARKAMSRLGVRALKFPFQSKDIEKILKDISACTQTISLALQVDQTYVGNLFLSTLT